MLFHHLQLVQYREDFTGCDTDEDHVVSFDAEQVADNDENIKIFAATGTKIKPRKLVKKHESQVSDRDKKVVVLHDDNKEVHITQPVQFCNTPNFSTLI